MGFLEDIGDAVTRLGVFAESNVPAAELPSSAVRLSDASVRDALGMVAGIVRQATTLQAVLVGIAAARSGRERGHGGLVQETGHRNPVEFVRDVTGVTRGEAIRVVKVGEALVDGLDGHEAAATLSGVDPDTAGPGGTPAPVMWHEPLREALLGGTITTAQHHAIRAGLGEPPVIDGHLSDAVVEASECTVEELGARARALKDMLDPAGAEERYAVRFEKRSYRWSTTADGARSAHIVFDDEMGEWVQVMIDAALAPRRGGPRFVSEGETRKAAALVEDPRTNEQLAYDLFVDVLRAGALADAKDVYGAKEAGIRLVAMKDAITGEHVHRDVIGRLIAVAYSEDGALTVPGSVLERTLCATGNVEVIVDTCGNPLDVGREQRLFTARQRLTFAVRDGGCLWPGCDRPPAYCEAHHCEHWADGGGTDCATGVLLCRYHHLTLHNNGWRIDRAPGGGFVLYPPPGVGGEPVPLRSKAPLRWLWDPPPDRVGWRTAA